MFLKFRDIFNPFVHESSEINHRAQIVHALFIGLLVISILGIIYSVINNLIMQLTAASVVFISTCCLYVLLRKGRILFVARLLPLLLWLAAVNTTIFSGGIQSSSFASLTIVVLVAGLTLEPWGGLIYSLLSILSGGILILLDNTGFLPSGIEETSISILISYGFTILGIGFLLFLVTRVISKNLHTSWSFEIKSREAVSFLEKKVQDLENHSSTLEQKLSIVNCLIALNELTPIVDSEHELLEKAAHISVNQLQAGRVAIFLVDESVEKAVLRAVNVTNDKDLLDSNNTLKITTSPQFSAVTDENILKIQNIDQSVFVSRPSSYPGMTRNISLPMLLKGKLLGLVNFQFASPDQWKGDEDLLQIVVNEITIIMDHIRISGEFHRISEEINRLTGTSTQSAWKSITSKRVLGFEYDQVQMLPMSENFPPDVLLELNNQKSTSYKTMGNLSAARLVSSITLRGQVIGVIGYENSNPDYDWLPTEKAVLETIASRVGLALENSRLVADAEQRAEREQIIGRIASRMRETLDLDIILQTTLQELHRSFELEEAEIRLLNPNSSAEAE